MKEMIPKVSVIIVDDHPIFRAGFISFLQTKSNINKIYESSNAMAFFEILKSAKIDLAFVDINMPIKNGLEVTEEALKLYPKLKIIGISSFENIDYIDKMLELGAMGYILKDAEPHEIEASIEKVLNGDFYFSNKVLVKLSQRIVVNKTKRDLPEISEREFEVLKLLCKGASRMEIAGKLFISERTVDKHRENIQHKTNTLNVVQLVLYALKNQLINLNEI
jgi:DNA-binding NarL/FixJ family response regulator